MQNKKKERGVDGKFVIIKDGIEDISDICYGLMKLIPMTLICLFIINYFKLWEVITNFGKIIVNLGNPNCQIKCIDKDAVDINN